jgi:hypothetical protein
MLIKPLQIVHQIAEGGGEHYIGAAADGRLVEHEVNHNV